MACVGKMSKSLEIQRDLKKIKGQKKFVPKAELLNKF